MLAMTAVLIPPVLVALVLVTMAVLDVLVGMAAVLDVLVVTGSSGLTTIFMITTAPVADTATYPNETRSPIITNFLRDTSKPAIVSFIPPRPPESSTSSRAVGAGPAIRMTSHTGIAITSSKGGALGSGRRGSARVEDGAMLARIASAASHGSRALWGGGGGRCRPSRRRRSCRLSLSRSMAS